MTEEQEDKEGFSKRESTVTSTSIHSSHVQSGTGMPSHETSQKSVH